MDRLARILCGLDINGKTGVEIGALCRPLIIQSKHDVIYADHVSTEALREKYRHDPGVAVDEIVEVDAVLEGRSLSQALGREVDYVIASHVIESAGCGLHLCGKGAAASAP